MGGVTRALFGGGKNTSSQTSENQAFGTLLGALKGNIGQGNQAMTTLGSILGIGDPAAGKAATDNFLNSTGYQTMMDSGRDAITGSHATAGLFNSGATGKALTSFGQDLGKTKVMELMSQLTGLGNYGLQSAGTIAGAGGRSEGTSKGTSSGGIFNSLFPGGLSDRSVKNIIKKLGELSDGLPVYEFEYKGAPGIPYVGVMAQDVKALRPDALGPVTTTGHMTVNYDKIDYEGFPAWGRKQEAA